MQKHGVHYIRRADIFAGYCYISDMKNYLCFTTISGTSRQVEFANIKYIRPIEIVGMCGQRFYNINITDVVYTDTGETAKETRISMFALDDRVTYRGKTYELNDFNRLCMIVENENNLAVLENL